jgi:hypothetical protein
LLEVSEEVTAPIGGVAVDGGSCLVYLALLLVGLAGGPLG